MRNVNQVKNAVVGMWRICIALVLVVVTSPIFWLIDYDKLILFVKRYGIDVMAVLSVLLGSWMYLDTHPVRGLLFAVFCVLMSILQHPDVYFE